MEDINIDFSSDTDKQVKEMPKWKKYLISGGATSTLLIIVIIIIILIAKSGQGNSKKEAIGEISCNYDITDINSETTILGEKFNYKKNFDILIGDEKIDFTKKYKFKKLNTVEVIFKIYDNINMDYMFKDVSALTSVVMLSTKGAKATSMISTFENCKNLKDFLFSGFDTSSVK